MRIYIMYICGATTCRACKGRVVGESILLASRASHTLAPSRLPRALTHAAASWPAVPPTSDDASGLICGWRFMSPCWWSGHKPAGWLGRVVFGMAAGVRDTGFWFCGSAGLWFVNGWLVRRWGRRSRESGCLSIVGVVILESKEYGLTLVVTLEDRR